MRLHINAWVWFRNGYTTHLPLRKTLIDTFVLRVLFHAAASPSVDLESQLIFQANLLLSTFPFYIARLSAVLRAHFFHALLKLVL